MSLEDLERAGITLPRDQWGKREVRSTVNRPLFLAAAGGAVVAGILMYWGNGDITTWIGAILFLASLFTVTGVALRAVGAPCRDATGTEAADANRRTTGS